MQKKSILFLKVKKQNRDNALGKRTGNKVSLIM